jgi:hypothetical protein
MFTSCSSIRGRLYLSIIDAKGREQILSDERNVREFLENVLVSPEEYVITAYVRCLTKNQRKRTKLMTHSYYVVSDPSREYRTLSFFGTDFSFYSEGAWAMDTDLDMSSYLSYIGGNNRWDVREIETANGIDTEKTIQNIIEKMDSNVRYYFRDHLNNKQGMNNCNTALWDTLAYAEEE